MENEGYVLARRYIGSSEYTMFDVFYGDGAYSRADEERLKQQPNDKDHLYEIFSIEEWNAKK